MSLPAILPANTVSIYGYQSLQGISSVAQGFQFGIIDQMYFGAQSDLVGQSVLFRLDKSLQLNYDNATYFLIQEEDIILTENSELL